MRLSALATFALVPLLFPPSVGAGAAATCATNEFNQPFVFLNASQDQVTLRVQGNRIQYDAGAGFQDCGSATRNGTDFITVEDRSSGDVAVTIDLSGGAFAPGFPDEPGGTAEVEWAINLGGGDGDEVIVLGGPGADHIVAGTLGLNLNAGEEAAAPDLDTTTFAGVNAVILKGGVGGDTLSAGGDTATGGPCAIFAWLVGEGGDDTIQGGAAGDALHGGDGADAIMGGAGNDMLWGGAGNDRLSGDDGADELLDDDGDDDLSGGAGRDLASYRQATSGVRVDLALTSRQDTIGAGRDLLTAVENLEGSPFSDLLLGTSGRNHIQAGDGMAGPTAVTGHERNELDGRGGNDTLIGGAWHDVLVGRRGDDSMRGGGRGDNLYGGRGGDSLRGNRGADWLFGGSGSDVLRGNAGRDRLDGGSNVTDRCNGGSGNDQLQACEVLFG